MYIVTVVGLLMIVSLSNMITLLKYVSNITIVCVQTLNKRTKLRCMYCIILHCIALYISVLLHYYIDLY